LSPRENHKKGMSSFEGKNYTLAFGHWRRAAEMGLPEAMCDVGWMFSQGLGIDKIDTTKAFEWMLKAAEKGYVRAQNNVGLYFKNGTGTARDIERAVHWLGQAEKAGYAKLAKKTLSEARDEVKRNDEQTAHKEYQKGLGLFAKEQHADAFKHWLSAANQGYAKAMCDVGWMYSQGHGQAKNEKEAFKWMLKSAEAGYVRAQNNVGLYYKNGTGCKADLEECVNWLSRAESSGYEKMAAKALKDARRLLKGDKKEKELTPEQKQFESAYLDTLRILLSMGATNINEQQRHMLAKMRQKNDISDAQHKKCLDQLGVSESEFDGVGKVEQSAGPVRECVVCMDAQSDHIILDCMHMCLCENCAKMAGKGQMLETCPTCRKPIKEVRKAYVT